MRRARSSNSNLPPIREVNKARPQELFNSLTTVGGIVSNTQFMVNVFGFLRPSELRVACRVNRHWNDTIKQNAYLNAKRTNRWSHLSGLWRGVLSGSAPLWVVYLHLNFDEPHQLTGFGYQLPASALYDLAENSYTKVCYPPLR